MYNIYNKSNVFYLWKASEQKEYLVGDERDLIHLIAKNYRPVFDWWDWLYDKPEVRKWRNPLLDSFACNVNEIGKEFQFFDGFGRCINPQLYEKEAFRVFTECYKDKKQYFYWRKNYKNKGVFRYDPVPYTSKYKGGPGHSHRRIKHLKQMYANPEYKEFNRGSHKEVPEGWWDDWSRCRQKNWKKHRKHQWKEKKE